MHLLYFKPKFKKSKFMIFYSITTVLFSLFVLFILDQLTIKVILPYFFTQSAVEQIQEDAEFVKFRKVVKRNFLNFKGTIFIYPPTGGENIVDRLYARDLAYAGYEVFILQDWTDYTLQGFKYELHNTFYGAAQNALNKTIKQASTKNLGVLGTSVGALHTSVALTTNPFLRTGFTIVGGLTIPELIVTSSQPAMKTLKSKRYHEYKLKTEDQYLKELEAVFRLEPTSQHQNFSIGKKIGSIVSTNDDLVPFENQKKLNAFFKSNPVYISDLNHTNTVAWYGLFKRKLVIDFFKSNL